MVSQCRGRRLAAPATAAGACVESTTTKGRDAGVRKQRWLAGRRSTLCCSLDFNLVATETRMNCTVKFVENYFEYLKQHITKNNVGFSGAEYCELG